VLRATLFRQRLALRDQIVDRVCARDADNAGELQRHCEHSPPQHCPS
jgi:hypothetical protein